MKLSALLLVALIGGGGYYMMSDPFKAKVDQLVEDHTEWTAENIQENPEGYLRWAISELGKSKNQLKARKLEMRKKNSLATQNLALSKGLIGQVGEKMAKLKTAYRTAVATQTWPATIDGIKVSESNLKTMVIDADRRIKNANRKNELNRIIQVKATSSLRVIENKLNELNTQETELHSKLSEAKLSKVVDNLESIQGNVREIVATALAIDTDYAKEISLDDLTAPSTEANQVDAAFDKIMGN